MDKKIPETVKQVIQETILDFEAVVKLRNQNSKLAKEKAFVFKKIKAKEDWSAEDKVFLENHYTELKSYNEGVPIPQCKALVKEAEEILAYLKVG
jgi:uncharacterized FlgJ-related protein